ncbi:MAG: single-stranded-DNA-specific exonuclease RecJ [Aquificaceae bacterium]|nr:single-stranded-DNA-specific exonuclease RecJ [Aquificaceae bacterium]
MRGISGKEWLLLSEVIKPDEELVRKVGYLKAQFLANRNMDETVLENKLKNLLPPFEIPNITTASEIIAEYVRKGKRIVLFGDYDVDGITGTAMLYHLLKQAGAKVLPLLPSRKKGYGLTKELALRLSRYADLLITVDNGTSAVEELNLMSIPTIVLDHHNPGEDLPSVLIVNPKLGRGEVREFRELSSSGLAFYLSVLLRRELELDVDVRDYLHLACLGTVADVVPMNLLNRIIVSNGIKLLNHILKGSLPLPGMRLLMERSGIKEEVSSRDIAFSLAPRLNAPGRVAKPYVSFKLILEKDEKRAQELMDKIDRLNQYRKHLSQSAFEEALKQAQAQKGERVIVIRLEEWAGGVAGIVAGRLSKAFNKPAVVLSVGREYASASVRGTEGVDVYTSLKVLSHLFVKWGGHSSAAGFTIRSEQVPLFERLVKEVFSEEWRERGKVYIDMSLPFSSINQNLYNLLRELEPYGEGFPEPLFLSEPVDLMPVRREEQKLTLRVGDFFLVVWDNLLTKSMEFPVRKRRVVYQIDRRRAKTLLLVDLEA